ncbi:STAS domain-containing protein [Kitasatospora sp. NPDC059648]|uniref:STAS domain-containing protein n=1 Tax=Kitasatospora sp. NPDC059648 TaxID=3346894 RepID=UPI0036C4C354
MASSPMLLDLHEVTFTDPAGLHALLPTRIQADRQGAAGYLLRPFDQVARLLDITGCDQVLPLDMDVPLPRLARWNCRVHRTANPGRSP